MKYSLFLFLIIFAQAIYGQNIKKEPQNILDYYYLLPKQPFEYYEGNDDLVSLRKNYITQLKVILDYKNEYLKIEDTVAELFRSITITYFKKENNEKIIAVHNFLEGGDCDYYETHFLSFSDSRWKEIDKDVLPEFSIYDFELDEISTKIPDFLNLDSNVYLKFTLPQFGTSISLEPVGVGEAICFQPEVASSQNFNSYEEMEEVLFELYPQVLASRRLQQLVLKWNKTKGVFEFEK